MNTLTFKVHTDFSINPQVWADAEPVDVANLLDNIISNFYENLDTNLIPKRSVFVTNSSCLNPPTNLPEIRLANMSSHIYLATSGKP